MSGLLLIALIALPVAATASPRSYSVLAVELDVPEKLELGKPGRVSASVASSHHAEVKDVAVQFSVSAEGADANEMLELKDRRTAIPSVAAGATATATARLVARRRGLVSIAAHVSSPLREGKIAASADANRTVALLGSRAIAATEANKAEFEVDEALVPSMNGLAGRDPSLVADAALVSADPLVFELTLRNESGRALSITDRNIGVRNWRLTVHAADPARRLEIQVAIRPRMRRDKETIAPGLAWTSRVTITDAAQLAEVRRMGAPLRFEHEYDLYPFKVFRGGYYEDLFVGRARSVSR